MPTVVDTDTEPQVSVKRVLVVIGLVGTVPNMPSNGKTDVLNPLVPVMVQEPGGLTTL